MIINGSPRKDGNMDAMMNAAEEVLRHEGVEVERVSLAERDVRPCNACDACYDDHWDCPIDDDAIPVLKKMVKADGILMGSPVYFGGVTAQLKALMDRSIMPYQESELKDKVGGALSVAGATHGGQELTITQIAIYFMTHDMQLANAGGGGYGAMGTANDKGDMAKDEEGLESAKALAARMAHLLKAKGL